MSQRYCELIDQCHPVGGLPGAAQKVVQALCHEIDQLRETIRLYRERPNKVPKPKRQKRKPLVECTAEDLLKRKRVEASKLKARVEELKRIEVEHAQLLAERDALIDERTRLIDDGYWPVGYWDEHNPKWEFNHGVNKA